jgi:hypothetical protein
MHLCTLPAACVVGERLQTASIGHHCQVPAHHRHGRCRPQTTPPAHHRTYRKTASREPPPVRPQRRPPAPPAPPARAPPPITSTAIRHTVTSFSLKILDTSRLSGRCVIGLRREDLVLDASHLLHEPHDLAAVAILVVVPHVPASAHTSVRSKDLEATTEPPPPTTSSSEFPPSLLLRVVLLASRPP